jgi:hypothetical protein
VSAEEARERLLQAALRCLSAERAGEHAHKAAEIEYADEQLAIAARDLAAATGALPADRQPVGWAS